MTIKQKENCDNVFDILIPSPFKNGAHSRVGRVLQLQCGDWIAICQSTTINTGATLSPVSTTKQTKEAAIDWVKDVYETFEAIRQTELAQT